MKMGVVKFYNKGQQEAEKQKQLTGKELTCCADDRCVFTWVTLCNTTNVKQSISTTQSSEKHTHVHVTRRRQTRFCRDENLSSADGFRDSVFDRNQGTHLCWYKTRRHSPPWQMTDQLNSVSPTEKKTYYYLDNYFVAIVI